MVKHTSLYEILCYDVLEYGIDRQMMLDLLSLKDPEDFFSNGRRL